jgi:hypothetical protein
MNIPLGSVPAVMVEKVKSILSLLGKKGSLRLEAENSRINIPVSDDVSVDVYAPNAVHYQFIGDKLIVTFEQQPLVRYKGSGLLSKYLKSITAGPEQITIDCGWITASLDIEQ